MLSCLISVSPLPQVRPVGYDGNNPTSVAEWLESLELGDYTKSFLVNGYTSMELVKKIWEIELINVSHASTASRVNFHLMILVNGSILLHVNVPHVTLCSFCLSSGVVMRREQKGILCLSVALDWVLLEHSSKAEGL